MYVGRKLMEGGMVEQSRARDIFEEIRYARRDPALLEWIDGTVCVLVDHLAPGTTTEADAGAVSCRNGGETTAKIQVAHFAYGGACTVPAHRCEPAVDPAAALV
jgi:hypothetical protein